MTYLETPYEVLGLTEKATQEEIKRAYFSAVRRFPPSEHPEVFQRFNDANAILSDTQRRKEYDQTWRHGRQVQCLVQQALQSVEKDPWKAVRLLKNAVVLAPALPEPRTLLCDKLLELGEFASAEAELLWLTRRAPDDAVLSYKLGRSRWMQGRPAEAEAALREAILRNPFHYDAYLVLADALTALCRVEEAANQR